MKGVIHKMNQKTRHVGADALKSAQQKGITLIALVITIIVLLILAGVTINMVLGDEGIIAQAQQAKERNEEASDLEIIKLAYLNEKSNELNPKFETDKTIEERMRIQLENTYGEGKVDVEKNDEGYEVTIYKGSNKIYNKGGDGTVEYSEKTAIELATAEDIYALSRILAIDNSKINFIYTNEEVLSIEDDLNCFDIPEEITEESEKINYLQSGSYKLMNDIELTMRKGTGELFFLGIGTNQNPFTGSFDGNGKTIKLLSVGNISLNGYCDIGNGLFGRTENANILNVNVEIANDLIYTQAVKQLFLGGLVGHARTTKFNNCSVTISDSNFGVNYPSSGTYVQPPYVGGMVGYSNRSVYNDCEVILDNSSIIAKGGNYDSSTVQYAMFSVGGLIGFSQSGSDNTEGTIGLLGNQLYNCKLVSNNTEQKDVIIASVETGQEICAGGLVGCTFNNFVAKNCSAYVTKGNIIATKTGESDINSYYGTQTGGIVGRLEHTGELYNCNVTGDYLNIISKSPNNESNAGGIVGVDIGPYHRDVISINNCSFDGSGTSNVSLEITSDDDVVKYIGVGGIAGRSTYKIVGCSVKDTIITNKAEGNKYWPRAGSIVGFLADSSLWKNGTYFTPNISTSEITNCEASGITFDVSDNVIISNYSID